MRRYFMKYPAMMLLCIALLSPVSAQCKDGNVIERITPEMVFSLMKEGSSLWLVDVQRAVSYKECHIEGALNIPTEELRFKALPKDKLMVVVDDSLGNIEAENSAAVLASKGALKVRVLDGGLYEWSKMGYPLAGTSASKRSVTPVPVTVADFKKALKSAVPMKIYDIRGAGQEQARIPGIEVVSGSDVGARINNLADTLDKAKGKGLASSLKKSSQIVLVFNAQDDAVRESFKVSRKSVGDVRYLLGGYEAMFAVRGTGVITSSGECPTCPKTESTVDAR